MSLEFAVSVIWKSLKLKINLTCKESSSIAIIWEKGIKQ